MALRQRQPRPLPWSLRLSVRQHLRPAWNGKPEFASIPALPRPVHPQIVIVGITFYELTSTRILGSRQTAPKWPGRRKCARLSLTALEQVCVSRRARDSAESVYGKVITIRPETCPRRSLLIARLTSERGAAVRWLRIFPELAIASTSRRSWRVPTALV